MKPTTTRDPEERPGRVRARPGGGLLGARIASASIALVPPAPLARRSAAEVERWFSGEALSPLARSGQELPISLVVREREGGRRYPFHVPGYCGPRLVSERAYRSVSPGGRVLLPAIPRAERGAFAAPPGHRYLLADIDRCFPALLATVAGDDALMEAVRGDLHQEAGDAMAPHLPTDGRRRLGKRFNNAVIGLISPAGWGRHLHDLGLDVSEAEAAAMHARWWARFPAARTFRDTWSDLHHAAARDGRCLQLAFPDGRPYTFDAATVRGFAPRPRWAHLTDPTARLDASVRTTFSAIWRGIEGVILDEAIARLHLLGQDGLRLVLPVYDGLVVQAPASHAERLAVEVHGALLQALAAVGVPATVTITDAATWAGSDGR